MLLLLPLLRLLRLLLLLLLLLLLRRETKGKTFATSALATAFALGLLVVEGRLGCRS